MCTVQHQRIEYCSIWSACIYLGVLSFRETYNWVGYIVAQTRTALVKDKLVILFLYQTEMAQQTLKAEEANGYPAFNPARPGAKNETNKATQTNHGGVQGY